jgi:glycosyltransferase involved in cell wall biosynthesis
LGQAVKILLATMQFGRGYFQGTERYVATLARGLLATGHAVEVLAGDPEQRRPSARLGAVVEEPAAGISGLRLRAYPTRGWMTVRGIPPQELGPLLADIRPDVIHLANPAHIGTGLIEAARHAGCPVVVTVMDYWWVCPKHTLLHYRTGVCDGAVPWQECARCMLAGHAGRQPLLVRAALAVGPVAAPLFVLGALARGQSAGEARRWLRRRRILLEQLNAVGAVIFPSRTARALLSPSLTRPRVHSIPYGLEARWFAHPASTPQTSAQATPGPRAPAQLTLGYAGALAQHKGVHLLLEALQQLGWRATRVRIAGDGDDPAYQTRLRAAAAGLNVEFLGRVPADDMPAFLASLDALVVPSTWPENLPLIVLEARALGVTVLASRVGGIAELVDDPRCLFDVGSVASLADRLEAWRQDAAATADTPTPVATAAEMVSQTLAVYRDLLEHK